MTMRLAGMNDEPSPDWDLHIGLDALEQIPTRFVALRAVDGKNVEDLSDTAFAEAVEQIRSRKFSITSLVSNLGQAPLEAENLPGQIETLHLLLERARAAGTTCIRTMGFAKIPGMSQRTQQERTVAWLREMARLAQGAGCTLMLENAPDADQLTHSPSGCMEVLSAVDSDALKLLFDPANFFRVGHDPLGALTQLVAHVGEVHIKDLHQRGDPTSFCLPGQGAANIGQCLAVLSEAGFGGCLTLEPHMRHFESNHYSGFEEYVKAGKALVELAEKLHVELEP
jgi:sugar phosphate isomerase/epimerase